MSIQLEKISDAEIVVLRTLWDAGRALSVTEIRASLSKTSNWEASTIKTLLSRLRDKGAVSTEKRGVFYYTPEVTERQLADHAARNVIGKLYGGSAKNLVTALLDSGGLSNDDVNELRALLKAGDSND